MVAGLRLLDPLQVLGQVVLGEEGGAVDPGQLLTVLVAAPVGTGHRVQLDHLDLLGAGTVRAAAEILEGTVAVERDRLRAFVGDQVLDQLDLELLVLGPEDLDRFGDGHVTPLELLVGLDVTPHRFLDLRQVRVGDLDVLGEVEVVVEAVVDRRSDRHPGARVQLLDRGRHHVGRVVADQLETLRVTAGDDRDLFTVGQRGAQVPDLVPDLDRQRGPGQAGPDRGGGIGTRGPSGQLERGAIGQGDCHFRLDGAHRAIVKVCRRRAATWSNPARLDRITVMLNQP